MPFALDLFVKLVEQVRIQLPQLKYFEQHGPALTSAIQAGLKQLVTAVRECLLQPDSAPHKVKLYDAGRAFARCICSFLELFTYANDSAMEDNAKDRVQAVASAMAQVLQSATTGDMTTAEQLTTQLMANVSRLSVSLRLRASLTPSEDKQRLLARLRLQLKQVSFKLAAQVKGGTSGSLDAMKQVRAILIHCDKAS